MKAQSGLQAPGLYERFTLARRKRVKRFGKNFIRGMSDFIARQSRVGDLPVYDNADFPFVKMLEDNWQVIRGELDEVLKHREAIPSFLEVSKDQKKIASDERWRTFLLFGFGERMETNCKFAPKTAEMLSQVPGLQTAFFSILGPNYHVPPHRGVSKTIMRSHVGLIVPKDRENCTIRIEDQTVAWEEGKAFVFDDTYDHEVWNRTDEDRVVLLFDFNRPMKFWGQVLHKIFLAGLRLTAYYQEPKRNLPGLDARFEAAVKRSQDILEN
ncbi:MAG: aspartyl/asparaginyl beta-hydroxylase domain-containing protein [Alphaproteobacteria bacterium]|nr:aspartyl/asparaginyl beta-hydroxylase domain-containing protein [Alphaproteobacteria bacterium]